jgi:prolyl oligopeptidase
MGCSQVARTRITTLRGVLWRASLCVGLTIAPPLGWVLAGCSAARPPPVPLASSSAPGPSSAPVASSSAAQPSDPAPRGDTVDIIHGIEVRDPYRWMEDGSSDATKAWDQKMRARFLEYSEPLPQRVWLHDRVLQLETYDDETRPRPCHGSKRTVFEARSASQGQSTIIVQDGPSGPRRTVLDPNTWDKGESLTETSFSRDCRYLAYSKARAGDENPTLRILALDKNEELPDTVRGTRPGGIRWLHDGSGFYYAGNPAAGEVPEAEQRYWHRVWFHKLRTKAEQDWIAFQDAKVKEHRHDAAVSEDGRSVVFTRFRQSKQAVFLGRAGHQGEPRPMATDLDAEYRVRALDQRIFIRTDWNAPLYRVMTTTVDKPARESWKELIPETGDRLSSFALVGGKLYAVYLHNASTRIVIHAVDGKRLRELKLPSIGSAWVEGEWSRPEVWVPFGSFTEPPSILRYNEGHDTLDVFRKAQVPAQSVDMETEQVWYVSKDGTRISMFLLHRKGVPKDGTTPWLLTGYGSGNISTVPWFYAKYAAWVEAGGGIALPNLRGGGEYGRAWHEAGMKERKQTTFDDFFAAAEWLERNGFTRRARLAIAGASAGGILVAAAITQRPELFRAALAEVPVTDMVRFHKFGLLSILTAEYGNPDDPAALPGILAWSPYHRVKQGTDYPAVLIVAGSNDARANPLHARKFGAALQWADADHGATQPILIDIEPESGHAGGLDPEAKAAQVSRQYAFLMSQVGLGASR